MKLVDLIKYFRDDNSLAQFFSEYNYVRGDETILIYMRDELNLNSDLFFFSEQQTGDRLIFEKEGTTYFQLFPLEMGVEFYSYFEQFFKANKYTDQQKAQRLLEYVINDA